MFLELLEWAGLHVEEGTWAAAAAAVLEWAGLHVKEGALAAAAGERKLHEALELLVCQLQVEEGAWAAVVLDGAQSVAPND